MLNNQFNARTNLEFKSNYFSLFFIITRYVCTMRLDAFNIYYIVCLSFHLSENYFNLFLGVTFFDCKTFGTPDCDILFNYYCIVTSFSYKQRSYSLKNYFKTVFNSIPNVYVVFSLLSLRRLLCNKLFQLSSLVSYTRRKIKPVFVDPCDYESDSVIIVAPGQYEIE